MGFDYITPSKLHHISAIFANQFAFSHAKKKPNLGKSLGTETNNYGESDRTTG